jgi:hypothetical protein
MSCDYTNGLGLFLYFVGILDQKEMVEAWTVYGAVWPRNGG